MDRRCSYPSSAALQKIYGIAGKTGMWAARSSLTGSDEAILWTAGGGTAMTASHNPGCRQLPGNARDTLLFPHLLAVVTSSY